MNFWSPCKSRHCWPLGLFILLCRGFAVGIYATNTPDACHYVAEDCEANILVVENDAQLQKILKVRDRLPHLRAIIQYTGTLTERYSNVYTVSPCIDNQLQQSTKKRLRPFKINCTFWVTSLVPFPVSKGKTHAKYFIEKMTLFGLRCS